MEDSRRGGSGGGCGATTTTTTTAANKKKRKNKRRRDPRKGPSSNNTVAAARGPPLAPVLKVTIRNIHSGGTADVAERIRALIRSANEKLTALDPKLVLDEAHLKQLVVDDEKKLVVEVEADRNESADSAVNGDVKAEKAAAGDTTVDETKPDNESTAVKDTPEYLAAAIGANLHISDHENSVNLRNQIVTRVLYMVPPKKTRRRGEKPGVAYLVLTAPPVEILASVVEPAVERSDETVASQKSTTTAASVTSSSSAPPPVVDYSRDVAKRRLMLQHALDAMQWVVSADASNNVDAMVVQESVNSKTWKQQQQPLLSKAVARASPLDRLTGTIFETDDYLQFLEKTAKEEEQRKARPKPAPGGSMAFGSGSAAAADAQPVAALVLHLQKKQEEEKMRKLAKRKAKDTKKKRVPGPSGSNVTAIVGAGSSGGGGGKLVDKKRGRRPKKKKGTPSNGKKSDATKPSGDGGG